MKGLIITEDTHDFWFSEAEVINLIELGSRKQARWEPQGAQGFREGRKESQQTENKKRKTEERRTLNN